MEGTRPRQGMMRTTLATVRYPLPFPAPIQQYLVVMRSKNTMHQARMLWRRHHSGYLCRRRYPVQSDSHRDYRSGTLRLATRVDDSSPSCGQKIMSTALPCRTMECKDSDLCSWLCEPYLYLIIKRQHFSSSFFIRPFF